MRHRLAIQADMDHTSQSMGDLGIITHPRFNYIYLTFVPSSLRRVSDSFAHLPEYAFMLS